MKKSLLLSLSAVLVSASLFAADGSKDKSDKGFLANLTADQKACIDKQNCPKKPDLKKGEKPTADQKAAIKASKDCMKKAFKTCNIDMPKKDKKSDDSKKTTASASSSSTNTK